MVFFPSACELRPMVSETLELLQQRALEKGLTFKLDIAKDVPQQVWVDGPRLCQVLRHLVDNAVKFTHQGEVSVTLALINHHLQIQVKDSGRGIPLQRQAHIFNRFESADLQTTKDFGGTGLGLSLCERLVVLQGGQIGVQSQPSSGALFWFEWPLSKPQTTDALPELALPSTSVFDVLVVDDNAMNLMITQLQLQAAWPQVKVTTAGSGAQALALLQAQHFDLALVDVVMPDMDGLALTRALRQLPVPAHQLPVVALTANTNPLDEQHCLEAGMDMVLHKPINPKAMARTISRAMALSLHRGRT
jgi:CheY-like chemotaxis protein